MLKNLLVPGLVVVLGLAGCAGPSNPEAEDAAVAGAKNWLAFVDAEEYEQSWNEASELFKAAVPRDQWLQSMVAIRKPLGKNTGRRVKVKRYRTTMPGAPDGEYVVIQFRSSFQNKQSAVETVTPMKDPNGQWRVSGYFIK